MEHEYIAEVLAPICNASIIKLNTRAFPGVLIQGDSLCNLRNIVKGAIQAFENSDMEEALNLCRECIEKIEGYLYVYETVLLEKGFSLPYSKADSVLKNKE